MPSRFHCLISALVPAACSAPTVCQSSNSFYPERLDDGAAVYLDDARFGAKGDGVADDTDALQKAINAVADEHHEGILFVPSGHYRITHTLFVWPSIRLIGFGAQRPTILPECGEYRSRWWALSHSRRSSMRIQARFTLR